MDTIELFKQYGVVGYGLAILFGGLIGVKYLPTKWETKYRFLGFSMIVAVVFVLLEVLVQKNFKAEDATKYLITFCIVAVAYQLMIKKLFTKWGWIEDEKPTS